MGYTPEYWEREGKRISEERKQRYANDPEYRAAILARAAEYREKRRAAKEAFLSDPKFIYKGKTYSAYTAEQLCEAVGITPKRLIYFQKKRYIPAAIATTPVRLYTTHQVKLIADLESFLEEHSKYLRASAMPEGQHAQAKFEELKKTITQEWEQE